jgi:hypothetical protein
MVGDTPPYGHAPTYQISMTYLERQKSYGPDKLRKTGCFYFSFREPKGEARENMEDF